MKIAISLLLALSMLLSGCGDATSTAGQETTVKVAAEYLDYIFMNTLASLELVASTPEAKNADWVGMKPYLEKLAL